MTLRMQCWMMVFLSGLTGVLVGCGGARPGVVRGGGQTLLERMPDKTPDWVGWTDATKEEKDAVLFLASARDGSDYNLTAVQAESEGVALAAKTIGEEISNRVRNSLLGANRLEGDVGRYVEKVTQEETRRFAVSGLSVRERYCERWGDASHGYARQYYNCWVLMSLPRVELDRARSRYVREAVLKVQGHPDRAAQEAAQAFARELAALEGTVDPAASRQLQP